MFGPLIDFHPRMQDNVQLRFNAGRFLSDRQLDGIIVDNNDANILTAIPPINGVLLPPSQRPHGQIQPERRNSRQNNLSADHVEHSIGNRSGLEWESLLSRTHPLRTTRARHENDGPHGTAVRFSRLVARLHWVIG